MTDFTLEQQRIGIVGLGLMGGSLALALRQHCRSLQGIDPQPAVRQRALQDSVVDAVAEDLATGIAEVDLLIVATPVRATTDLLAQLPDLRPDGLMVMDLGSTKQAVVAAMDSLPSPFATIGGHPMCGKETPGLAHATTDLYQGQTFVLCRTNRTTAEAEQAALHLVAAIGARPVFLTPTQHDRIVAEVSHLPYLVSAALMRVVADEQKWDISASGFRDVSRLAGSDTRMMLDILMTNRVEVLRTLQQYQTDLAVLESLLQEGNEAGLVDWLAEARVRHAAYRRHMSALPSERKPD